MGAPVAAAESPGFAAREICPIFRAFAIVSSTLSDFRHERAQKQEEEQFFFFFFYLTYLGKRELLHRLARDRDTARQR